MSRYVMGCRNLVSESAYDRGCVRDLAGTSGRVSLRPEIGAAWKHEFESDRGYDIDARLASGAGGVFTTRGPSLGRESALLNTGVSMEWTGRCATCLFYNGEIGRNRYDSHVLSGGVWISFWSSWAWLAIAPFKLLMTLKPQGFLVLVISLLAVPAMATTSWTDGEGDWFSADNWSSGVPDHITDADISNGGTARISLGRAAVAQSIVLGLDSPDAGHLSVDGGSSLIAVTLLVGNSGSGSLEINSGLVTAAYGLLGAGPGSFGAVTVAGAGSTFTNVAFLSIGNFGTGTLNIMNGGTASSPLSSVGNNPNSVGVVTVNGAGSTWNNTTQLFVGEQGSGTLRITNGGTVSDNVGGIGETRISSGLVIVDGAGSTWISNAQLVVGQNGTGTLEITNGGAVSNSFGSVGAGPGVQGLNFGTGLVLVDGAGSTWTNTDGLIIGGTGTGRLVITNGGAVLNVGSGSRAGTVASSVGSIGMVTVDGEGSTWTNRGDLYVGREGIGSMDVTRGGVISSASSFIGGAFLAFNANASGCVAVDGAGSTWTNSGQLFVGNFSTGTLNITNGGAVSDTVGNIGYAGAANGTVIVDGAGSTWRNSAQLYVGNLGVGSLCVTHGGAVSSSDSFIGYGILGQDFLRGLGTVTVDGAGSTWTNAGNLYVGGSNLGPGTAGLLRIDENGRVNATTTTVWRGGRVIDDSLLVSPHVSIMTGGLLLGCGTVAGDVANAGLVEPGHSPGTLTIGGNYNQFTDGTLRIEVAGRNPGQFDLLAIGGTANLNGALQVVRLNDFTFRRGDRLAILTAGGGINGVFHPVENPFAMSGTILQVAVIYEPNAVVLELVQGAFAALPGLTPNQQAVAANLDLTVNDPRANALIDFLDAEPLGNLPRDLDLIAPEELTAIYETAFSQANVQSANLQRRLSDIRAGSTGFSASGYAIAGEKEFDPKATPRSSLMDARPDNRWGVFVTGTGQLVTVDGDLNAAGYEITSSGMTLGVDYRLTKVFALGLYGGYAHGKADLVNDGRIDTNSGKLGGYATFQSGAFYVNGIVGGGLNSYDTRRAALAGAARGETDGGEFSGEIASGYEWTLAGITIEPNASLRYTSVSFDGFTERGSLAPLQINGDDEQELQSTLGMKLTRDCKIGRVILRPEIGAAWKHEFESDRGYDINARLASGAGGVFTTRGPSLGRESALLNAGLSVGWSERYSTYLFYDGEIGRNRYDSHAVFGGVRISF